MILSNSAARMGSVKTTLRKIGKVGHRNHSIAIGRSGIRGKPQSSLSLNSRAPVASNVLRWKSTMASYSDDEEELMRSRDRNDAIKARPIFSHEEAWMINLGRDQNNEWLLGKRDSDDWFTGLKPDICPGVDARGIIRSLPLPKLDAVTRESAKEYFDNSWTLYETLFAGLKGEEGFYR